ncbi:MAG: zinc ribbon domain-containing protein [Desulfurococcaceae archaeon]
MSHCPGCGKEVPPEANYCPSCGVKFKIDVDLIQEEIAEARHEELVGYAMADGWFRHSFHDHKCCFDKHRREKV